MRKKTKRFLLKMLLKPIAWAASLLLKLLKKAASSFLKWLEQFHPVSILIALGMASSLCNCFLRLPILDLCCAFWLAEALYFWLRGLD